MKRSLLRSLTRSGLIASGCLSVFALSAPASAEDLRAHVHAGGSHALGGSQSSEFGTGGMGSVSVEMPATPRLGVQASAGALVLSKGDAPKDAAIAPTNTGAAFLGTVGLRARAFGASRVGGPWIDSNVGVAQTGASTRPAFDAKLGWDVRVSKSSRIDVGPFVGYTQIFQPDDALRGSDARVLTAGLSISLGAKERPRSIEPAANGEKPAPVAPPPVFVPDARPETTLTVIPPTCPDGEERVLDADGSEDGCIGNVRIFENRILLDDVVHFEFDSARIRDRSVRLVKKVAHFISERPDIVDISVEGHADEIGADDYNQKLSVARAASMVEMLAQFGVERSRLRVIGHGKSQPKVVTLHAEEKNRRVEMFVTLVREDRPGQTKKAAQKGSPVAFGPSAN